MFKLELENGLIFCLVRVQSHRMKLMFEVPESGTSQNVKGLRLYLELCFLFHF